MFTSSDKTTGILIANLGTPDAPTPKAIRRYLREFLSDPRVIEMPRWLWWPILHGVILRTRPFYSARLYRKIWTEQGSPLLSTSKLQAQGIQDLLNARFPNQYKIALGMRYGSPSIAEAMSLLQSSAIKKLLILPLYPQYSGASTGAVFDAVSSILKTWRWVPELYFIDHYADHREYIHVLKNSVVKFWQEYGRSEKLLFSFHGIPQRNVNLGDPYERLCHTTSGLLAEQLQLDSQHWQVVFQSRLGRQEWLQPYCEITLRNLAKSGVKSVDIICPGFAADCLETLEEIKIRNKKLFIKAGGERLNYIPALNDHPEHLAALTQILLNNPLP